MESDRYLITLFDETPYDFYEAWMALDDHT